MKLKKCILAGTLATAMLCESLFGSAITGLGGQDLLQVYAADNDETVDAVGDESEWDNIATGKTISASGVDTNNAGATADKAIDGDTDTSWSSADLNAKSPQWIQLDMGDLRTSVDHIKVIFGGKAWSTDYEILTSDTAKDGSWTQVKQVQNTSEDSDNHTDTIERNIRNEKIVLRRFVRFSFTGLNSHAGDGVTSISVAEIEIYGKAAERIYGPTIELTAPANNAYPEIATVKAEANGVSHTTLADRTTPAATLMGKGTGTQGTEKRTLASGAETTVPVWTDYESAEFETDDMDDDGVFGFTTLAQTPGTINKFDVYGADVKVISFQLYVKEFPNENKDIFGKGNKYAVQLGSDCIQVFMSTATSGNGESWPTEKYVIADKDSFVNQWHDILVVVDGKGKQRLYVDGNAPTDSQHANTPAIAAEIPYGGLQPFTFGYNLANGDGTKEFTSTYGYMARFKFYTDKDYHGITNGAGTDISDAQVLSEETADAIDIAALEAAVGEDNKSDVYYIITNMLQKESPTARISLCPYSRSTVWSKYDADSEAWVDMDADEKFQNVSNAKYRATTVLEADDGFVFDDDCRTNVVKNVQTGDSNALTTVDISDKDRKLTIITYYGCTDADLPDTTCAFEELILNTDNEDSDYNYDEIRMVYDEDASNGQNTKTIVEPTAVVTRCTDHQAAEVAYTYTVTKGNDYITVDSDTRVITPKKVSKLKLGYDQVTITVTATLQDKNGDDVKVDDKVVSATETISVYVDAPAAETDTVISTAPKITSIAPVAHSYPEVAEVRLGATSAHFDDIADRMEPAATLEPLTTDYIATLPTNQQPSTNPTLAEDATIENIDGVWAFNAQGQTPGTENKFDVFGTDVKLISFKLYLKKWPTSGNVSIFGKGDKYAVQVTSAKQLYMFMENTDGGWPTEIYEAGDDFLETWHNVFMVVDGKGMQRIYVDGVPSTSRNASLSAIAKENPKHGRKPFSLGYNSSDTDNGRFNWWEQIFTTDYGYISDVEFYTNKNYYDMVNGAGDNISDAQVISDDLAAQIDISDLEEKYGIEGDVGTVLTNLLQTSNATVAISTTPYVTKTTWSQMVDGEVSEPKPTEAFGYASQYVSTTTLTAYDGFVFDESIKDDVESNFKALDAEGNELSSDDAPTVVATFSSDKKTMTVTATYQETPEAPCTCEIAELNLPETTLPIQIPENATSATGNLTDMTATGFDWSEVVKIACEKDDHPVTGAPLFTYQITEGSDVISLDVSTMTVTAAKSGTATITVTATYMVPDEDGEWVKYLNGEGDEVSETATITVTVTNANRASDTAITTLQTAVANAKTDFPEDDEAYYTLTAWTELQDAIAQAEEALPTNGDPITGTVSAAQTRLDNAISAMATSKSEKGLAKDDLDAALDAAKVIYEAGQGDYTDATWIPFKEAYEAADLSADELKAADTAKLTTLANALKSAKEALSTGTTGGNTTGGTQGGSQGGNQDGNQGGNQGGNPGGGQGGTTLAIGKTVTVASGTYQVTDNVKNEVIIIKGTDAKKVTIPATVLVDGVTCNVVGIGNNAFKGAKKLTNIVIGTNVTSIGNKAFSGAKKLKKVTIGKAVTTIGKQAFFNCKKLSTVTVKGTAIKKIGAKAFKGTAAKIKVKLPKMKAKQKNALKKLLKRAKISSKATIK